jgi:hypothetical protein
MLTRLWTIGVKVPDLEKELEFHKQIGSTLILDETLEFEGDSYRIPLVRMGDKYLHLAEKMVYEKLLGQPLPCGMTHLVYVSDNFDGDVDRCLAGGATPLMDVATVSAQFGERRVAFLRAPGGWIFEIIQIYRNLVPEV